MALDREVAEERPEQAAPEPELSLFHDLEQWTGAPCVDCGRRLCGHQVLFSVVLGLKTTPRCLSCLAGRLEQPAADLRDRLAEYVQHRACYRRAWDAASDHEGLPRGRHPGCLWPGSAPPSPSFRPAESASEGTGEPVSVQGRWDAGDMACGDLVFALRIRLQQFPPGAVLKVTARDPAAPEDLPAWCRLTGHRLVLASHPEYFIERKRG